MLHSWERIYPLKPLDSCLLYAFIDFGYLAGRDPLLVAAQLCAGGADLIQLRAKNFSADEVERLAEKLLPLTEQAGVGLVINDHLSVANRVGAPLCHLGQEDFAGHTHVNELKRPERHLRIGLSTHNPDQARAAEAAGADYLAVGPVYATPTKPAVQPVGLEYVRWAAQHLATPWFAIGGINLHTLDQVLEAGATRVCVVSAILQSPDPARACQEFKQRLNAANSRPV